MDGHFVPNMTFGPPIIKQLSKFSNLPLDVHLMVTNPEFYVDNLKDTKLNNITFHYEAVDNPLKLIKKIKESTNAGISIKPKTNIDVLSKDLLEALDVILIMSVEPGFGGQKFMPDSLSKLEKLNKLKQENGYKFQLQIDGGINEETAKLARKAGATNLVAGSYIFNNNPQDYLTLVDKLR